MARQPLGKVLVSSAIVLSAMVSTGMVGTLMLAMTAVGYVLCRSGQRKPLVDLK